MKTKVKVAILFEFEGDKLPDYDLEQIARDVAQQMIDLADFNHEHWGHYYDEIFTEITAKVTE